MKKELALQIKTPRNSEEFEKGRRLLYQELGGFFSKENISTKSQGGDVVMLEALAGGEVVGACFGYYDPERSRDFLVRANLSPLLARECFCAAGLAVSKEWRGRGVALLLLQTREKLAGLLGYSYLLGESWLESPSPSANLLKKAGMEKIRQIENNWEKNYPIPNYCPRCGDICYCTAILFWKEIE